MTKQPIRENISYYEGIFEEKWYGLLGPSILIARISSMKCSPDSDNDNGHDACLLAQHPNNCHQRNAHDPRTIPEKNEK